MKKIKSLSYVLVLAISFSGVTPVVAQNAQRSPEHVNKMKTEFERLRKKLMGYIKCFASEKGCSRARKVAFWSSIVLMLVLIGQHKHTEEERIKRELEEGEKELSEVARTGNDDGNNE